MEAAASRPKDIKKTNYVCVRWRGTGVSCVRAGVRAYFNERNTDGLLECAMFDEPYTTKLQNWDHTEAAPESGWPQVRGRWKTATHPPRHGPTKT